MANTSKGRAPSPTRRSRFPRQEVYMLTDEMADRILKDAEDNGMSKSEVVRTYIQAGMDAADELDENYSEEYLS